MCPYRRSGNGTSNRRTPAPALAGFATRAEVTELVLARTRPGRAGRYPVLRDLARLARDVELHILPADQAG